MTSATAEKQFKERHQDHLNDSPRLARINHEAGGSWHAVAYDHWHGMTVADAALTMGTGIKPLRLPLKRSARPCRKAFGRGCRFSMSLGAPPPFSFDARTKWDACPSIRTIRNQGNCGSCWAFAAAGTLQDRFCIAGLKQNNTSLTTQIQKLQNLSLSPQFMIDCSDENAGCQGGHLDDAWEFLQSSGIPQESCSPYSHCPKPSEPACGFGEHWGNKSSAPSRPPQIDISALDSNKQCPHGCSSRPRDHAQQLYRARSVYAVSAPGDVEAIQHEIYLNGPVEAAFFVFSDFHSYRNGTYFRTPSAYGPLGGHAVRLIGWGVDRQDTDYWLVANSFGPRWGMDGFFRIRRGTNECGIETMPAAGLPDLRSFKQMI